MLQALEPLLGVGTIFWLLLYYSWVNMNTVWDNVILQDDNTEAGMISWAKYLSHCGSDIKGFSANLKIM